MISSESLGLVRFALSIILIFLQKDVSEKSLLAHMHQNTPNNTNSCFPESKRVSCGCCTLATKYQADTVGLGSLVLSLALPLQTIGRPDNKTHTPKVRTTPAIQNSSMSNRHLFYNQAMYHIMKVAILIPPPPKHTDTHTLRKRIIQSPNFFFNACRVVSFNHLGNRDLVVIAKIPVTIPTSFVLCE